MSLQEDFLALTYLRSTPGDTWNDACTMFSYYDTKSSIDLIITLEEPVKLR